jgi:spermidine synthase
VTRRQAAAPDGRPSDGGSRRAYRLAPPSVFLISFSILVFEIALTRIFSIMLSYHFVFAIVSAAMLGLGAGGFLFKWLRGSARDGAIWTGAFVYSLSLAASVVLILTLPIVGSAGLAGVRLWVYIVLAIVPFAAGGFAVAGLFRRFPEGSSLLYGADLIGAAAGALAVVPAMDAWGGVNVVFLAAGVAAGGALLLGLPRLRRVLPAVAALIVFAGLFVAFDHSGAGPNVPIANDPSKEMQGMLADPSLGARVVESRWSSFGRTDLVASDRLPNEMEIFVDGAAGSPMYNLDALRKDPQQRMELEMHSGESFPFPLLKAGQKRSALILGPGGGRDVAVALLGGVKQITAVEVNPDVVKIVRQYSDFNGGIYSGRPGVTVVIGDGRNFVRTTDKRFDLIMAAIPVTKSSRSVDGYALTENGLFTVEAMGEYLDRLTNDGRLVFVAHNDVEIYKLIAIVLAAYRAQGVSEAEAMTHLYTVGAEMMPALVVQKQPVTAGEANVIHRRLHQLGFDKSATFVPQIPQQTAGSLRMFDQALVDISAGSLSIATVAKETTFDLRPATDDRPFFYKYERGLPSPFGVFAVVLALAAVVLGVLVALPRKAGSVSRTFVGQLRQNPKLKGYLVLFFALGIGYMLIEIAFFQKLSPFISQPQTALTVLLFSLLLGGGLGSVLTALLTRSKRPAAAVLLSICVAGLVAILVFVFPRAFEIGIDPRLAAMLVVLPLGILMGCPFPLALHGLSKDGLQSHTALLWGVNGAASVLGSALAMIIGLSWGFSGALFLGAAIYLGIAALFAMFATSARRDLAVASR